MEVDASVLDRRSGLDDFGARSNRGRLVGGSGGSEVWKGLVAGFAGGIAGTWMMTQFQNLWSAVAEGGNRADAERSGERAGEGGNGGDGEREVSSDRGDQSSTEKAADAISRGLFGHELTDRERATASTAISYAFGTAMGTVYGVAAELMPSTRAGAGLLFGAAVWAGADEGVVPALGLSEPPREAPAAAHAFGLASHLVYGLATDATRLLVRTLLR